MSTPSRILYIDCDSLRPDHLGCYGYHRDTSPNIDQIAADGRRFESVYTSDSPCLPSRTALFSGRFGVHTGVMTHGGKNADPRSLGRERGFGVRNEPEREFKSWLLALRECGYHTASISSFPTRHRAWHVLEGFREWIDPSDRELATGVEPGEELAETVWEHAEPWLDTHASDEGWFLHLNFWDAHTPYDKFEFFDNPFEDEPAPGWVDQDLIDEQYEGYGPYCARDLHGVGWTIDLPGVPHEIGTTADYRQWIDGYDTCIRYMDQYIGKVLDALEAAGVLEETLIILSADHGENQGELNIYGGHCTADRPTNRVPLLMRGPGVQSGVDAGLHYQLDLTPTVTDLIDGDTSDRWDGRSFVQALEGESATGREALIVNHGVWTCQRAVRWDRWLLIRTYHPGLKDPEDLPPVLLFDIEEDPREQHNLAPDRPNIVETGLAHLQRWEAKNLTRSATGQAGGAPDATSIADPLMEIINDGGPASCRGRYENYVEHLRETDRSAAAAQLEAELETDRTVDRTLQWTR